MEVAGDERLADRLRELLGARHRVAAAAVVTADGTTTASLGAGPAADLEIGSVSKGVTGLLYADALERGEVTARTLLGDVLPLAGTPAGGVTLGALSTHSSGLPRLPAAAQPYRRTLALYRRGTNPYGESLEELLEQARGTHVGRPEPRYSNLGFELLGHAVGAAVGTTYAALLRDRVVRPLGLHDAARGPAAGGEVGGTAGNRSAAAGRGSGGERAFYAPATPADLRPQALLGASRRGRPREAWTGEAIAPAGGIRASIGSMARLTAALLDGTAPGIGALDPVAPLGSGARIGAAWVTVTVKGRTVTWHNGGTGGFRSWLGLDRRAGTGVVILSAMSSSVDREGFALLAEQR